MKNRACALALSLSLLLVLLSGCGQAPVPDPAPSSHNNTSEPAVNSEPAEVPLQETPSERPTNQLEPQSPVVTPRLDAGQGGAVTAVVPSESEEYTSTAKGNSIPAFTGSAYAVVNDNCPYFLDHELSTAEFESYSELDALGRCGVAFANVSSQLYAR